MLDWKEMQRNQIQKKIQAALFVRNVFLRNDLGKKASSEIRPNSEGAAYCQQQCWQEYA